MNAVGVGFWLAITALVILVVGAALLRHSRGVPKGRARGGSNRGDEPPASSPGRAAELHGDGSFGLGIVGESHYLASFEAVLGPRTSAGVNERVTVTLLREPDNPYDRNAVGVYLDGRKVGYLSRNDALRYRATLESDEHHGTATCRAVIRGGWDDGEGRVGDYGVWLDLPPPRASREELDAADRASVRQTIARLRGLKSKEARARTIAAALDGLASAEHRRELLLEASRIEVAATLEKVASLKSSGVKRKHLHAAIAALEADEIPDDLQAAELQRLKEALTQLTVESRARRARDRDHGR